MKTLLLFLFVSIHSFSQSPDGFGNIKLGMNETAIDKILNRKAILIDGEQNKMAAAELLQLAKSPDATAVYKIKKVDIKNMFSLFGRGILQYLREPGVEFLYAPEFTFAGIKLKSLTLVLKDGILKLAYMEGYDDFYNLVKVKGAQESTEKISGGCPSGNQGGHFVSEMTDNKNTAVYMHSTVYDTKCQLMEVFNFKIAANDFINSQITKNEFAKK